MTQNPYERFRTMITAGLRPGRFESSVNRFKSLQELAPMATADKSNALDQASPQADPMLDKGIRDKMMKHEKEARQARFKSLKRIRELAITDFNMLGGVAPIGSMGGSGGGDGYRPVSLGSRQ